MTIREDKNKYANIHQWLLRKYGKASKCEKGDEHQGKRFEWACVGVYEKNRDMFIQLCPSCHRKMDYTDEQKIKVGEAARGRISAKRRVIKQIGPKNEQWIYPSLTEASIKTGIIRTAISNVISGKSQTAGNYKWEYV